MRPPRFIIAIVLLLAAGATAAHALVVKPILSQNGSFIYSGFSFGNSAFGTGRF